MSASTGLCGGQREITVPTATAFDLKLDHTVALKFLPPAANSNSRLLERFRGEVRIARQVSHRNVCRVHDISETDGVAFISMEYIDGDNLGTLLKQIGHLPSDKALELARRLCAGLAAAHEKGVLHRDLKPANIMIDRRGQLLITDFGLAAAADAIPGTDIRSGTPAYMAPEQKEGREVTVRSDIYSLGLVLAEMFTGEKASQDGRLTATAKDLDPAIEKVIQRCLNPNPLNRPASALDVSRTLPGGDPLAEALAAGDTPSPQMVAASEDTGALSVWAAASCLVIIIAGLAGFVFWGSRTTTINMTPMPYAPEVLKQKAQDTVARLGYTDVPLDVQGRFYLDNDYVTWAKESLKPAGRRDLLAQGEPPEFIFHYVQSPRYLVPANSQSLLTLTDPVRPSGAADLWLDPQGRLRFFRAIPQRELQPLPTFDWKRILEAAGLDPSRWTPADPQEVPPTAFDARAAWTGSYASAPQIPLRIEAAAWQGRPVSFEIFGPWRPKRDSPVAPRSILRTGGTIVEVALVVLAILLARRNFRAGRGDLTGAARLATLTCVCAAIGFVPLAHHTPLADFEVATVLIILAISLAQAALAWALYIAIEPYVRRRWPQVLIGWSRILAGHFRDPLVSGHILAGMVAGMVIMTIRSAVGARGAPLDSDPRALLGLLNLGAWSADVPNSIFPALVMFFVFVLLRLIFRTTWLTAAVLLAFIASSIYFAGIEGIRTTVTAIVLMLVSIRFGMLALVAAIIVMDIAGRYLITPNFSAFYAPKGWQELGLVLVISFWCFRNALGGRKLFKSDFLEG